MIIGTCSLCGGAVCVPDIWHGTVPPIPTCESCGAYKKQVHGPVIEMVPPLTQQDNLTQRFNDLNKPLMKWDRLKQCFVDDDEK